MTEILPLTGTNTTRAICSTCCPAARSRLACRLASARARARGTITVRFATVPISYAGCSCNCSAQCRAGSKSD